MNNTITRREVANRRWINTSIIRSDGKEEFRERKEYGNRHAVFDAGNQIGRVHNDRYNATDVPFGTIDHAVNYVEEKTGIPKTGIKIFGAALALVLAYKLSK